MPHVKVDPGAGDTTPSRRPALPSGMSVLYLVLVPLLAVFAVAPLTYPGSFQTQTGFNCIYNLIDLDAHINYFPGWAPIFGNGYDLLRMDGPFPYFVAESFHLLGLSFEGCIKLVYALGFVISGLGMFLLSRRIFKNDAAGVLAAVTCVYFPYHLAEVYVRGALGESTEWALLPLALISAVSLHTSPSPSRRGFLFLVIMFVLIVLTLPGLGLLFGLATLSAFIILRRQLSIRVRNVEGGVVIGLVIGLALLVSSFLNNRHIPSVSGFVPAFVYPFQFLTASWGNSIPKGNFLDQFPYQLGIGAIGLTVLALALNFRPNAVTLITGGQRRVVLYALFATAVALLVMTPIAAILWQATGLIYLMEYPFQLLTFVGLALSIVAGSVVLGDVRLRRPSLIAGLALIPILGVYGYLAPDFLGFAPSHPPIARFNNDEIALLDAKIARPPGILRHGATVELDLYWQALKQVDHDYTVFVHAVDSEGKQWGGQDTKPQNGALPTIQWDVGRVISDTHTIQIDLAGPPEGYQLELGIYSGPNGDRALTETGASEIRIRENGE